MSRYNIKRVKHFMTAAGPRFYQVDGFSGLFPSVTTVLDVISKPHLAEWNKRLALDSVRESFVVAMREGTMQPDGEWLDSALKRAATEAVKTSYLAADFGAKAHTIIEEVVQEKDPEIPAKFLTVVNNFKLWRNQCRMNIVQTETMVASVKYGFAGCIDAVALKDDDGKLCILDWKTSKQLSNEHAMQISAYAKAFEETTDQKVDEAWIVRFDKTKTPKFEARQVRDIDGAFDVFLNALGLWNGLNAQRAAYFF